MVLTAAVTHADMDIHTEFIAYKKDLIFYAGKPVLNKVHAFYDVERTPWDFSGAIDLYFTIWEEREGGLQKFDVPVLTIPMMNFELYNKLGYFWHPGYRSMFVDEHLYWRSKKLNALQMAPHLKFEHRHVSVGKAQDDETYRRSAANWDQGKKLFAQHKAMGFTV